MLSTYRRLIALRRSSEALRSGTLRLATTGTPDVLAWHRDTPGERLLIVANFAGEPRSATLPSGAAETYRPIGGSHLDPSGPVDRTTLVLRPLEAVDPAGGLSRPIVRCYDGPRITLDSTPEVAQCRSIS